MKIALFNKPYIVKVSSFLILIPLITSTPLIAYANVFDDIRAVFSSQAQAEETIPTNDNNSQNVGIISTESVNPDVKNPNESKDIVIVKNDTLISSDELSTITGIKFDKSTISDQIKVYTVKQGDTLSEIADDFDISVNTIRWENNISGQNVIIGQKLNILPMTGVKHIVKKGDTISRIADKYDAEAEDISVFNGISDGDSLNQGDIIFVPNGIIKTVVPTKPISSGSSVSNKSTASNTKVQSGYYMRPVSGPITSPYGARKGGFHPGVDIGNAKGTTIDAAADGVVTVVVTGCVEGRASCGGGYGNHIDIQHSNGTMTRYGHLSKTSVTVGQNVSQGDKIGEMGSTGNSTGYHLHFEIRNSSGSTMKPPVY